MKPSKNRIFCNGCKRHKMLFETQPKADNFIKFNSNDILEETGKAPIRSYYCEFCGGYHVTSNTSEEIGERLDQNYHKKMVEISSFYKESIQFQKLYSETANLLEKVKRCIKKNNIKETFLLFDEIDSNLNKMSQLQTEKITKYMVLKQRRNKLWDAFQEIYNKQDTSDNERNLDKETNKKRILDLINIIENIKTNYSLGKLDKCKSQLLLAFFLFEHIGADDENTKIILDELNRIQTKLYNDI